MKSKIDRMNVILYDAVNTLCTAYKATVQTEQAMVYHGAGPIW